MAYVLLFAMATLSQGYSCQGPSGSGYKNRNTAFQPIQQLRPAPNTPPQSFEPYLKSQPGDETARSSALVWYGRRVNNPKQLQLHTLQMIQHHPANMYIRFENTAAFYADPGYRAQVIAALEKQVHNGHKEPGTYLNLAYICEKGALPPVGNDPNKRKQFLQYMGLPQGTKLRNTIDRSLADKALRYYQLAQQESKRQGDTIAAAEASEGSGRLQMRLNEK